MESLENELARLISSIRPADREAMERAEKRQAELAKPPGSLGRLERLSVKLAGITGEVHNDFRNRALLVFCADNGVTEEGVASAPRSVTLAQTINLTRGKTGAAVLSRAFGCRLLVCDVGVAARIREPAVIDRKIAFGTKNIAKGPAMTRDEALRAILTGADLADQAVREGARALGVGEMGIGNTTTSSAVLSVLTGASIRDVTGRGAGITDEAYRKKLRVIEQAVSLNRPDPADPADVLAKVGGFDLAAMTGAFLGAASNRVPAVVDGFISIVAALSAARLCPTVRDYLIPSHASYEIGYRLAAEELGLEPLFDLQMRLGEGSGVPIAMSMIDAACTVINDMATFDEAGIDDGYLDPIREGDAFSVNRGEEGENG
ncbi:MAG: nicotinate-nucleotide--dimethylbenzimidazole phosphoribosyltransferase [Ruminococcaceae bacterium]|jgi:nicotinate-nucleotide--dimethylbenzimidazole phosphoribosyltransferase|nr:nicotinate-nucleotide--dimethylbenzimidazole phosphoribosyltransferase [Oscillospiraceae bacterium]